MMPRFDKLQVLIGREGLRLLKNPSALLVLGLLVAFSLLLALSRNDKKHAMSCWIVYPDALATSGPGGGPDLFIEKLTALAKQNDAIRVLPLREVPVKREQPVYPPFTCAIELLALPGDRLPGDVSAGDASPGQLNVAYHFSGGKSDVLEPFLRWFWPIAMDQFAQVQVIETAPKVRRQVSSAALMMERLQSGSLKDLMNEDLAAAVLLLVIQFVTCCQLIVSFTSQDRERGTLTALALSPITMSELLQAKILFHLMLSAIGCGTVIAVLKPAALAHGSLWATLLLTSLGFCSVGMVIASLTKTQNSASLLALCYMLVGAVVFYLATKFSGFGGVKSLAFENYSFGLVYVSLQRPIPLLRALDLPPMLALVTGWLASATFLFRTRGWL